MPPQIINAEYLQYSNQAKNSDKIYNIFLLEEANGTYSCVSEYGRRGAWPVTVLLCSNKPRLVAEHVFRQKVEAKRRHRETPYWDSIDGPDQSPFAKEHGNRQVSTDDVPEPKAVSSLTKQAAGSKPKINGILNQGQIDSLEI
ncbi:MAG: hypothetical protein KF855_11615 [Acidobacteria bacterium]|nr:hypothetical protein [Acidobacteriota bacterium]